MSQAFNKQESIQASKQAPYGLSFHRAASARPALAVAALALAFAAGCASPNTGDQMKSHAASVEDISKQWKKGNDLVVAGEKTKSKGSELVAEGQKQIEAGESQIARGKTLMAESESAFRDTSRRSSLSSR
ncbi:MAG: hypothetical protein AB7G13_19980 [Lautropia sp.]